MYCGWVKFCRFRLRTIDPEGFFPQEKGMPTDSGKYIPSSIESHWQGFWETHKVFRADNGDSSRPKYYVLDMFPYPSGAGLHIGHPEGYTASDILARYKRAKGFNVLHPMGWDAFGLPAEQYAVKTGTHPASTTARNIETFREQIKRLGFAIDWDREINTTDPDYYKWTQWIFLRLFQAGLVYVEEKPVWWCPELRSVLANEEIVDGKSEVGNFPVERKNLRQVVLRITRYADSLLSGLEGLDWPDSTKRQQQAWIGRSEGARITFSTDTTPAREIEVFTTRPDTLFGCTYMVLAPEHEAVAALTMDDRRSEVEAYIEVARGKSDLDRTDLAKEKSGVFTGSYAINPVNDQRIPIWVADYVLVSYGTGAIMAVPAHDERDFEFAEAFDLPVTQVIDPEEKAEDGDFKVYCGEGRLINSGPYTDLPSKEAARKITTDLEEKGRGRFAVNYRLRDWIFSRQRYWGEPIPIVWVEAEAYQKAAALPSGPIRDLLPTEPVTSEMRGGTLYALPLPLGSLPLKLPEVESYQPAGTGESPLATIPEWTEVWIHLESGETRPRQNLSGTGGPGNGWVAGTRETNTMPQWAGSCWYHLRYMDPDNSEALVGKEAEAYWKTPDFYVGGAEHAVLHLLYARFWHRFLFDIGVVSQPEPYQRLFHQGIILGEDGEKMSKSRGNVINPDTIIEAHGADALRLFEMFLGPLEAMKPWKTSGIEGISRFLRKVWKTFVSPQGTVSETIQEDGQESTETLRVLHQTIDKVESDIDSLRFNTAISQLMICINHLQKRGEIALETARTYFRLLAPFAPHLAEELWALYGGEPSIVNHPWPEVDRSLLETKTVRYALQVNGKVRGQMDLPAEADREAVLSAARQHEKIAAHLAEKTIRKEIHVPGKIVNFVVS